MVEFWLDTADPDEVHRIAQEKPVDGITTNYKMLDSVTLPSIKLQLLLEKARAWAIPKICLMVQCIDEGQILSPRFILDEARTIQNISTLPEVIVKIPATKEGLSIISTASAYGVKINLTCCFDASVLQDAGRYVKYVSVIISRDERYQKGKKNHELWGSFRDFVWERDRAFGSAGPKIIAASLHTRTDVGEAIYNGADIVTIPPSTWEQMGPQYHQTVKMVEDMHS